MQFLYFKHFQKILPLSIRYVKTIAFMIPRLHIKDARLEFLSK